LNIKLLLFAKTDFHIIILSFWLLMIFPIAFSLTYIFDISLYLID